MARSIRPASSLPQDNVMQHATIFAELAVLCEEIIDGHLAHFGQLNQAAGGLGLGTRARTFYGARLDSRSSNRIQFFRKFFVLLHIAYT
jgi:hypothetical protein